MGRDVTLATAAATGGHATDAISHDATASEVKTALEALPPVGLLSVDYDSGAALCSAGGTQTTVTFHQQSGDLPTLRLYNGLASTGGTPSLSTADCVCPLLPSASALSVLVLTTLCHSCGRHQGGPGVQWARQVRHQHRSVLLLWRLWLILQCGHHRNQHGGRGCQRDGPPPPLVRVQLQDCLHLPQ